MKKHFGSFFISNSHEGTESHGPNHTIFTLLAKANDND